MEFRVYDKWKEKYLEPEKISVNGAGEILVLEFKEEPGKFYAEVSKDHDRYEIERCLTKRDLNNKKCYASDVVKFKGEDWIIIYNELSMEFEMRRYSMPHYLHIPPSFELICPLKDYVKRKEIE